MLEFGERNYKLLNEANFYFSHFQNSKFAFKATVNEYEIYATIENPSNLYIDNGAHEYYELLEMSVIKCNIFKDTILVDSTEENNEDINAKAN